MNKAVQSLTWGRDFLSELTARIKLSDVVGQSLALTGRSSEFTALCPFHEEKTPSFTVSDDKGFYHCFGCGAHGDALDWLQAHDGLSFMDAVYLLADMAGLAVPGDRRSDQERQSLAARRKQRVSVRSQEQLSAQRQDVLHRERVARSEAHALWRGSVCADGTLVSDYLLSRGIAVDSMGALPGSLRFNQNCNYYHRDRKSGAVIRGTFPAMVAAVLRTDCNASKGRVFAGVHVTWLSVSAGADPVSDDGVDPELRARIDAGLSVRSFGGAVVGKADVPVNKKMRGPVGGGAIRLGAVGPDLALGEGIETALSVAQATDLPCWAGLSLGNMGRVILPPEVKVVWLCEEKDMKDRVAAEISTARNVDLLSRQGVEVRLVSPPEGMDFNDVLQSGDVLQSDGGGPDPVRPP